MAFLDQILSGWFLSIKILQLFSLLALTGQRRDNRPQLTGLSSNRQLAGRSQRGTTRTEVLLEEDDELSEDDVDVDPGGEWSDGRLLEPEV